MKELYVKKRDKSLVPLDLEKIHQVLEWASEGIKNVSISQIEINANLQFKNGISTKEIQEILIKSASDLISPKTPNYDVLAGRLYLMHKRKETFNKFNPDSLLSVINKNVKSGHYEDITKMYSNEEIEYFDSKLKHKLDEYMTYSMLRTNYDYYAISKNTKPIESIQQLFMLIPMVLFNRRTDRKERILRYYNNLNTGKISLPSPIMSGVRTKLKGYSSCCLIDSGDTKESLIAANGVSAFMTTLRAGIGSSKVDVRGLGANVGKNTKHAGITNILKWEQGAVKSFVQGSRGGSSTNYFACWNWEIERIIKLKSNKLPDDEAVRGLDYGIGFTDLFIERALNNEDWTLFSAEETRDLSKNLYNKELWEETYINYEKKPGIRKKKINALNFLKEYLTEYFETGRLYPVFLSRVNEGPFKDSLYMSNLCCEILLPVKPLKHLYDPEGEVALCILSNLNAGKIRKVEDIPQIAEDVVYGLNELIDVQEYPVPAAKNSTLNGRYLAVGTSDWAHYLSLKKVKYDTQEALDLAEEWAEHLQFNLLKASNKLAKETGEAPWFRTRSKYADGWLPNDGKWRFIPKEEWEQLRKDIIEYGLKNLVLSAVPPAATSSDAFGATSGLDMPRDFVTVKNSKQGPVKQVVPNYSKGSQYYTLTGELDNIKYLEMISKFVMYNDQSISTNTYFKKSDLDEENKLPITRLLEVFFSAWEFGFKTLYYMNFDDSEIESCEGGGCSV